jgi:hypothetical protein
MSAPSLPVEEWTLPSATQYVCELKINSTGTVKKHLVVYGMHQCMSVSLSPCLSVVGIKAANIEISFAMWCISFRIIDGLFALVWVILLCLHLLSFHLNLIVQCDNGEMCLLLSRKIGWRMSISDAVRMRYILYQCSHSVVS